MITVEQIRQEIVNHPYIRGDYEGHVIQEYEILLACIDALEAERDTLKAALERKDKSHKLVLDLHYTRNKT